MHFIKHLIKLSLRLLSRIRIYFMLKRNKDKNIFVLYPFFVWNTTLFQRPQQIAISLSKNDNNLYFYCTKLPQNDRCYGLRKIKKNLYICSEYKYIMKQKHSKIILHTCSTDAISSLKDMKKALENNNKILYEYIDDFNSCFVENYSDDYFDKHKWLLKNKDIYVCTTADTLYKDAKKYRNNNLRLISNGVDYDSFAKDSYEVPDDLKKLKNKYKKIILYYGALADWFDYNLVIESSKKYNNYAFVLIGHPFDDTFKKSMFKKYKNIYYLGEKDHYYLYNYAKSSDLLVIPFKDNDITKSCNPIKIFEYMSCQRPILTTNMPECKKYKSVVVAKNEKEFINLIPKTIDKINDKKYLNDELKEAKQNSWDAKAKDIMDLLKL